MSNQPKNSDIWNYEHTGPSNFQEGNSLWPQNFLQDGTHLSQNIPNGSISSSTLPDFPSIWNRYNDPDRSLVNDFSQWSLNQPCSSRTNTFMWNEPQSNLPQINSNVPGKDVFQSPWAESWPPLGKEPSTSLSSAQIEASNKNIIPQSSQPNPSTSQEQSAAETKASADFNSPQNNHSQSSTQSTTEKLISERVNFPGKWGQKPIDQSAPWETEDDSVTPRQRQDSNVWRSEPPTGAQIWDSVPGGPSTPTASLNGSVASRISPQAINNPQPSSFNNWNYPSTSSFPTRSQFPTQGPSQGFGPPGSYRRQMPGTSSVTLSRQITEPPSLIGSMSSHRLNAWPSSSTSEIPGGNNLSHRSNTWASRPNIDPSMGNFLEGQFRNPSNINSIPNTPQAMPNHRSSLINYFMQQGFSRADVEDVLATGTTDIDQCLAILRSLQPATAGGTPFRGAPRNLATARLLTSPAASIDSAPFFGSLPNNQGVSNAPFGRGNLMRLPQRSNSMIQGSGAMGGLPGASFNAPLGGGVGGIGDDGLMSSLLGRPPAQNTTVPSFLESSSNVISPRNLQNPPNLQQIATLMSMKNDIQAQLSDLNEKSFLPNSPTSKKYSELVHNLQYVMHLLNNSNTAGNFGPPSGSNGFRSSRHNSYNDAFNQPPNVSPEENWLLIRDMSPRISALEIGELLDCVILEIHDLAAPGTYLFRVSSPEIARDVKRRCEAQFSSVIPSVVVMSGEAAAGLLLESAKLKNPIPAAVFG